MLETWRWFGPHDSVTLKHIRQAGARGVVTSLHDIPTGEVWPLEAILARKALIEAAGLTWEVVESLPLHNDLKTRSGDFRRYIDNYRTSLRHLGQAGVEVVCYNFMPVVDWTRTNLMHPSASGDQSHTLRFEMMDFAAYDLYMLQRPGAEGDYPDALLQRAKTRFDAMSPAERDLLEKNIIAGLPGGEGSYSREGIKAAIGQFIALGQAGLRDNLNAFVKDVLPTAEGAGIRLCIHPDDPPFTLFGLPRAMSTADDARALFRAAPSPHNGLTLCAGSFGSRPDNDLAAMAREFGERIFFVHLRNVQREEDGSFCESGHITGDNDMVGLIEALLDEEARRSAGGRRDRIPMRPDHGQLLEDEAGRPGINPGYSYAGRMKGLAELRGVIHALESLRAAGRLGCLLLLTCLISVLSVPAEQAMAEPARPNIVVILADDLGYGDIGAYGATQIRTPRIDKLAREGILFTQGYASANVCSPSRAGLMTGRYAIRSGLAWNVLESDSDYGLPPGEETLAELATRGGYRTMLVGKWHLGHLPSHWPSAQGFEHFYGVPFSNDMSGFALYDGTERVEYPVHQQTLTSRYTARATRFIGASSEQPFLLVVSHTFPHIPLFASPEFQGTSAAGLYGDTVEEIDWSTGEIIDALSNSGVLTNTLVIFTSDNGPFFEGATGGLRNRKGSTWEGGYRVPYLAYWPGTVKPGQVSDSMVSNLDIFATVAEVTGVTPEATTIDGRSLLPVFQDSSRQIHDYLYYFNNETVIGVRSANWKYVSHAYYRRHLGAFEAFDQLPGFSASYDLLFDMQGAGMESYSLADRQPAITSELKAVLEKFRRGVRGLGTHAPDDTFPESPADDR